MNDYIKDLGTISELLKSCFVAFDDALHINELITNKVEQFNNLHLLHRSYDAIFSQLIIDL